MASDILIVDDEADIRELVSGILEDEGHKTRLAKDSDEALRAIEERRPSLVILDIWLQGSKLDGLDVLARTKKLHPDLPVVIISGHGNIETAVRRSSAAPTTSSRSPSRRTGSCLSRRAPLKRRSCAGKTRS